MAKYYFKNYAIKQQDATKPAVIANRIKSVIISSPYEFINAKTMQIFTKIEKEVNSVS